MKRITNGSDHFVVSKGAFDEIYSRQGYYLEDEEEVVVSSGQIDPEPIIQSAEDELAELTALLEKPIAQWNKAEIKKFCEVNLIDISETRNAAEAKDLIKLFLEEKSQQE